MKKELAQACENYYKLGFNIIPVGYAKFVDIALYAFADEKACEDLVNKWGGNFLSRLRQLLKVPTFSSEIRNEVVKNFPHLQTPPSFFKTTGKRKGDNKNAYDFYYKVRQTPEEVRKIIEVYAPLASGVAIMLGHISNISVIDFDDTEELIKLLNANGFTCDANNIEEVLLQAFPENAIVRTYRGYHVYFKHDPEIPNRKGLGEYQHIEVRSKDVLVQAPPSVAGIEVVGGRAVVRRYQFLRELNEETKEAPLPEWILSLLKPQKRGEEVKHPIVSTTFTSLKDFLLQNLTPYWREGFRDLLCFTLAGMLRRGGISEAAALDIIATICDVTQDEEKAQRLKVVSYEYKLPLEGEKVCAGARKFYQVALDAGIPAEVAKLIINAIYGLKPSVDILNWFNDYQQLAQKIAALLRNDLVYNEKEDAFYAFSEEEKRWKELSNNTEALYYLMKACLELRKEIEEILQMQGVEFTKQVLNCLNKLMNKVFVRTNLFHAVRYMLTVQHSFPYLPPEVLDELPAPVGRITFHKNGALLWLTNGDTVFIPDSEEPHRRFFATHTVNSEVNEHADPTPFEEFVAEIVDDKDTADYLLQMLASVLGLGRNPFRKAIFCLGGGRNGKSSFFEILQAALGDKLVVSTLPSVITQNGNNENTSLSARYRLKGSAIAFTDEVPLEHINEEAFKAITGGETIVAKRLYKDVEAFPATFILCILSNMLPQNFKSQNFALADRIVCVKFPIRFADDITTETKAVKRRDENKVIALKENTPAVIAALRKHFKLAAQKNFRLEMPAKVLEITEPVRFAANALSYFLSVCIIEDPLAETKAKELHEAYKQFCKEHEVRAINYKQFTSQLRLLNYQLINKWDGLRCVGIKINFDALSATSETTTDTLLDEQDEEGEDVQEVKPFPLDAFDDDEGCDDEEKYELI